MTQEERRLLLIDLCARLPYGTICEDIYGNSGILFDLAPELNSVTLKISELGSTWTTDIDKVKPYLRPLSSMTEDETSELEEYLDAGEVDCNIEGGTLEDCVSNVIDWLNTHHFDYRGLISKGLAMEAPEGMYKI